MPKIVVVGSSNTDLVVHAKIPAPGETVIGDDFDVNFGGKGANQAVTVAKLGGDAYFVAKVGNDEYGKKSIENYKKVHLNVDNISIDSEVHSGVAFIVVDENGENAITVSSGANYRLCKSDIDRAADLIRSADIILMQLEIPIQIVKYVSDLAVAGCAKVVVNPAPATKLNDKLLSELYLITPNETECEILTGIKIVDNQSERMAAKSLLDKGVKNVILTVGSRGSRLFNQEGEFSIPAIPQKAVDTTAAGDVYNGALCVALSEGRSIEDAMRFATAASSLSVTRNGAQASIPDRQEVDKLESAVFQTHNN